MRCVQSNKMGAEWGEKGPFNPQFLLFCAFTALNPALNPHFLFIFRA
jgi:hypothetical protein